MIVGSVLQGGRRHKSLSEKKKVSLTCVNQCSTGVSQEEGQKKRFAQAYEAWESCLIEASMGLPDRKGIGN